MLYILVYVFVKNCNYTISEIFLSFFNASIMTTGWYIIAAIIMYAVFYVVFKYFKNSISKKIILEFILIICYMAISWLVGCNSWWYTSILGFGIGLIWAYRKEYIDDFIKNNYKIISFFTMLSFIIFYSLPYVLMKFNGIIFVGINIIISLIFIMLLNIIMMN